MLNDEDFERALFALPLAKPPHGMRERIMAMTVLASTRMRPAVFMRAHEIVAIGVLLALGTWLIASGVANGAGVAFESALVQLTGDITLTAWVGIGAVIAASFSIAPTSLQVPRLPMRRS